MNGQLNEIAKSIVEVEDELARAQRELTAASTRVNSLDGKRKTLHEILLKRVGANIRTRVFVVGTKVVSVEFERGVSVQEVETD